MPHNKRLTTYFKTSLQLQPRHIQCLFNHFDYLVIFWNIFHVERFWFSYFISVFLCLIGISIKFPKSNEFKNKSYDSFRKSGRNNTTVTFGPFLTYQRPSWDEFIDFWISLFKSKIIFSKTGIVSWYCDKWQFCW